MNTRYGIGVAAWAGALLLFASVFSDNLFAQTLDRIRLGYSGTGISSYSMEIGKRLGIFRRNGLDVEVVYVNSGSLLNQALIAGTFDVALSQGSEAMLAKMRGADMRIVAVIANVDQVAAGAHVDVQPQHVNVGHQELVSARAHIDEQPIADHQGGACTAVEFGDVSAALQRDELRALRFGRGAGSGGRRCGQVS